MAMFARGMVFDPRVIKPPAVGGLLNLSTYELFPFAYLRPGKLKKDHLCIGASDACDIVLNDPCVSSVHALVECRHGGTFRLLDAQSRNGVFRIMHPHSEKVSHLDLAVGQRIVLGFTTLLCVTENGHAPLAAFDVSEFAFTHHDARMTRLPVPEPPRKTLTLLWRAIRRGKRE